MNWKDRQIGSESPFILIGPFKLRIPFVHYRFEWPDYFQGLLMCAVDLAAIPLMMDLLGMPFEAAIAIVIINGLLYLIHHLLGDPVVPGWITPAIPLLIIFVEQFPQGPERVQALMAFQFCLGFLAILLGATKLAKRVVLLIPPAIKSGIIIGAGLAAIATVFEEGGRFDLFPYSISIAVGIAFYLIYSRHFGQLQKRNKVFGLIAKLGIFPIILVSVFLAPLFREAPWPSIEWGFTQPDFVLMIKQYTVLGVGLPPVSVFISTIPTVLAAYIVLFGDILQSQAILEEADEIRKDEQIDYNPDRAHLLFGARNLGMSIFGPDMTMAGPLWAAMHVVIVERFKQGRKAMDSIFGGAGSFRWGTNTGLLFLPIVSMVKPILGIALALTLLIQGFVSFRVGVLEASNQKDLGIAGIIAAALVVKGATWAFLIGIALTLLIYGSRFFYNHAEDSQTNDFIEKIKNNRK